ncbi:hypothetical protein BGP_3278 [Beggiatoa sp. PS]|nr:hypothetical protein BGP_3278 [Beggiatoa sp. PS]
MKKHFNTTGPCHPNEHYMLPTQERCVGLLDLIEQQQYSSIIADQQRQNDTVAGTYPTTQ